jgi:hypothetical protein
MNSTLFAVQVIFRNNSMMTTIESWFIPFDILTIVCAISSIGLATLFLFIIIQDKTCHTIPMMLVANSCLSHLIFRIDLLWMTVFKLQNDLKQIQDQDVFCVFRAYIGYVTCAVLNYSYLLQAIYRYITAIYPTRLFWQSRRIQILFICIAWIFSFVYPLVFKFTGEIIYDVDNQVCQLPLRFSCSIIYGSFCIYTFPVLMIMFIYWKLFRHVKAMSRRVVLANPIFRVRRELKMIRHLVIIITILLTMGAPYGIFLFMSLFNNTPKYHFRIAYIFIDVPLTLAMIALFQFTEPLKTSIMKRIKRWPNVVVARVA